MANVTPGTRFPSHCLTSSGDLHRGKGRVNDTTTNAVLGTKYPKGRG